MKRVQYLLNRLAVLALAGCALAGCASTSSLDQLAATTPTGSPFTQQLFKNYSYLANSFGGAADGGSFDTEGAVSIFDGGGDTDTLAEVFATKALIAARGSEPEAEPSIDSDSAAARDRLVHWLALAKDRFPADAARAQTDFDCWMLNSAVSSQAGAAAQCKASFDRSIARLENDGRPIPAPPPAPTATSAPDAYTVYFDFDSWSLSAQDLATISAAVDAARKGRQSAITVVGHTDTSGSENYNQNLSVKRANVVKDVMVQMGARPEAIHVSGVGEGDLAVPTGPGVREPKNRRTVITLVP